MTVYCITNKVDGKRYVGKTCQSLARRWTEHQRDSKRGSKTPLHRAIRKYGRDSFEVSAIGICDFFEELSDLEISKIKELRTHVSLGNGYNVAWGGEGCGLGNQHPCFGIPRTEETKEKIRKSLLGRPRSPEDIEKMKEGQRRSLKPRPKGIKPSSETREKMRLAQLGSKHPHSEETKIKIKFALHTRWHVERGLTNPNCGLCAA